MSPARVRLHRAEADRQVVRDRLAEARACSEEMTLSIAALERALRALDRQVDAAAGALLVEEQRTELS